MRWLAALIGAPAWLPWALLAGLVSMGGIAGAAYIKGRSDANANCREAELRSEIEALKRDIAVQKDADAFEDAARRETDKRNKQLEQEVKDYEEYVKTLPADARCALTDDDVRRLQPNP